MGRIRSKDIKQASFILVKKNPGKFSSDFEQTKEKINELKLFEEKKMRNKVAGYVSRIVKNQKRDA